MTRFAAGRLLFTVNALVVGLGGFAADMNSTHVYNPRWRPHAKFHNGQTMAVGVLLALASLTFAWRRAGDAKTNVLTAATFGGIYWWSQAAAIFFPGAGWTDPELLKPGQSMSQTPPQAYIDIGGTTLVLLSTWLSWPCARV